MKKASKNLAGWANALVFLSVVSIVIAVLGWLMDSAWTFDVLHFGLLFLILSPVLRGFSTLVQNAEEELDQRWMVKIENAEKDEK